jgi:hypothetical protein
MKSLALLLVGGWLAGNLIMFFVATQNFRTVDRLLASPTIEAAPALSSLPHDNMRMLLRHLSSELNRLYFFTWDLVQIAVGLAIVALLVLMNRKAEIILAGIMLLIVAIQLLFVTPRITAIGRALDFVPRNPLPPSAAPMMAEFWRLHGAFTGSDLVIVALGLVLAWKLRDSVS